MVPPVTPVLPAVCEHDACSVCVPPAIHLPETPSSCHLLAARPFRGPAGEVCEVGYWRRVEAGCHAAAEHHGRA